VLATHCQSIHALSAEFIEGTGALREVPTLGQMLRHEPRLSGWIQSPRQWLTAAGPYFDFEGREHRRGDGRPVPEARNFSAHTDAALQYLPSRVAGNQLLRSCHT